VQLQLKLIHSTPYRSIFPRTYPNFCWLSR